MPASPGFDARYEMSVLDFADETQADRRSGFIQAVSEAFHDPRPNPETEKLWIDLSLAQHARVLGVWRRQGEYGSGPRPVATYAAFEGTLNAGLAKVPLWMITDVTVSPAHRRRGLLRRMMTDDLAGAAAAGLPIAGLTASEATIYGRFGFGPATSDTQVRVDTSAGFALRERSSRAVELVEPGDVGDLVEANFARFHATTRGSVSRPLFYGPLLRGEWHPETGAADDRLRAAVTLGPDGRPDGHVVYRIEEIDGVRTLRVRDLVAATPEADLALWQLLGEVDLVERVQADRPGHDPLRWALADPRRISVKKAGDHVWLRILDVPAALAARPWFADGSLVLGVRDALGHTEGAFTVSAAGGRAVVEPGGEPEVTLDVSTLSALYLGDVDVATLAAAGLVVGSADAIQRFAALTDGGARPYCKTGW